ncbi:MAG TPA: hypothetical protein VK177_15710 [Flavobacteriales bacterium]|nr:hypothetical protein [Flavobacteriales bacterium]
MSESTTKPSNALYWIFLLLGLGGAATIFGVFFDSVSETDMINYSYPLAFFTIGGIAGLATGDGSKKLRNALIWGGIGLLLTFVFFVQIFPGL